MVALIKFSEFAAANLANNTNMTVGVSSSAGGQNFKTPFPLVWTTANRPSSPAVGVLGYNTTLGQYEFWNGAAWVQIAAGGSGTVSLGAANQLAYYQSNGTTVAGLLSANNSVLRTNGSGVPSWSTSLPSGLTLPIPIISGITNGSDAAAGDVGEFITSNVPNASSVNCVISGNAVDITSISLTAGDWDVWGNIQIQFSGNATTASLIWSSTMSAISPDASNYNAVTPDTICGGNVPSTRLNVTSTTPVYLTVQPYFSSGSAFCCGNISARRRR